ncbi:carbohydrate kinase family protein [Streptosporangium roseum]|uniref:Ribokinase-like domain-containing protein n=1 Tax=Streptosporangium roseum (strain ATCC 12428 / DSM 43021 / JCM 3005 / KCTC 9067 / NCIMB 10171 / NRRL 2505 / NI 9100) TaxID=479432 RepID=D2AUL7_STRRD|nr:carbohydrate kinase [Streptosporangium roseum]ACZ84879.1 ribokinase-like domain-containing protein [Streptosporangium roseum DSM 43021]
MPHTQVAVLGECVADAFATGSPSRGELALRVLPGGSPANTAVALSRLGTPTRFLGRISRDSFGALFRAHLGASGVDLTGCVTADEPSTLAVATLDESGQAGYTFYAEGSADWQWSTAELTAERLGDVSCLHTGSMALVGAPGAEHVEELLARTAVHATVSIDPNVRAAFVDLAVYRERMPLWCALADIVKLSDDDLGQIHPGEPLEEVCDAWHAAGARLIVVTRGPRGATVSLDGERATVPAPATEVVDTVGAGDSFTAAFLHRLHASGLLGGRLDSVGLDEAMEAAAFATRAAALTCSVAGANPPWAGDLNG